MSGQRRTKRDKRTEGREKKAGRMVRLIGMLPDSMLEEAVSEKSMREKTAEAEETENKAEKCARAVRGNGFRRKGTEKRRFLAVYRYAAAAGLCLLFAGALWGRSLRLTPHPESLNEREETGTANAGEGGAEIVADGQGQNANPEEGLVFAGSFFYRGLQYSDAGEPVREALPDGWSLLGYLTAMDGAFPAELQTEVAALSGCPVYGKTADGSVLADAGMYVAEKDGYRLYLPQENGNP